MIKLSGVLRKFTIALRAYYLAVFNGCSPLRISWDCEPSSGDALALEIEKGPNCFTTSSTRTSAAPLWLVRQCSEFNPIRKLHSNTLSWRYSEKAGNWVLFEGDEWTGMCIDEVDHVAMPPNPTKSLQLKSPVFMPTVTPFGDFDQVKPPFCGAYELIHVDSLDKAKELSEWYYGHWKRANPREAYHKEVGHDTKREENLQIGHLDSPSADVDAAQERHVLCHATSILPVQTA